MIPTTVQIFSLNIPCSGILSAELDVVLIINITLTPINTTSLHFKRKKICIKLENHVNNYVLIDSVPSHSSASNIFYFAVGCALSLITIITSCVTTYYIRNKKSRVNEENAPPAHTTLLTATTRNPASTSTYGSFRRMASYSLIDERSKDIQERIAELTIQR